MKKTQLFIKRPPPIQNNSNIKPRASITCPYCNYSGVISERTRVSSGGWIFFILTLSALIFCCPIAFIVFFAKAFKTSFRKCPMCKSEF